LILLSPHPYVLDCNGATGSILIMIWLQYDPAHRPTERPARLLVVMWGRSHDRATESIRAVVPLVWMIEQRKKRLSMQQMKYLTYSNL
jgi:hypothetical protein